MLRDFLLEVQVRTRMTLSSGKLDSDEKNFFFFSFSFSSLLSRAHLHPLLVYVILHEYTNEVPSYHITTLPTMSCGDGLKKELEKLMIDSFHRECKLETCSTPYSCFMGTRSGSKHMRRMQLEGIYQDLRFAKEIN
jgi:hypothetical protein